MPDCRERWTTYEITGEAFRASGRLYYAALAVGGRANEVEGSTR